MRPLQGNFDAGLEVDKRKERRHYSLPFVVFSCISKCTWLAVNYVYWLIGRMTLLTFISHFMLPRKEVHFWRSFEKTFVSLCKSPVMKKNARLSLYLQSYLSMTRGWDHDCERFFSWNWHFGLLFESLSHLRVFLAIIIWKKRASVTCCSWFLRKVLSLADKKQKGIWGFKSSWQEDLFFHNQSFNQLSGPLL